MKRLRFLGVLVVVAFLMNSALAVTEKGFTLDISQNPPDEPWSMVYVLLDSSVEYFIHTPQSAEDR